MVKSTHVDHSIGNRWRAAEIITSNRLIPENLPRTGIDGIHLAATRADINDTIGYCWRGPNATSSVSFPRLRQHSDICGSECPLIRVNMGVLRVKTEHDPARGSNVVSIDSGCSSCCGCGAEASRSRGMGEDLGSSSSMGIDRELSITPLVRCGKEKSNAPHNN